MSDNFYTYFTDTVNNISHVIPIESPAGSVSEGMVPEELFIVLVPHVKSFIWRSIRWFLLGTVMFTFIILTAFFLTFRTLFQQKKLSEIKSDFINNMTHEFKTPITTISLAADALRNNKVLDRREEIEKYVQIIKTENSRMNQQVETILEAALLEKNEIKLNLKPIHAITLIESALQNINLPLQEKKGRMTLKLDATNDLLSIDEVHFTNLISNLLDNAVKYSKDNPEIKITTSNTASVFIVSIEDNGIGMDRDTAKQIFEKFYRAHTGNLHNVKGFGLGLSYVKTMVDALGGVIKVDSVLGRGTIFTLQFPLIH
jgi:two-component system phosphate regulon sensor histidine kinase PhoR